MFIQLLIYDKTDRKQEISPFFFAEFWNFSLSLQIFEVMIS